MILKHGGTVDCGRFNARRTRDDRWQVSTKSSVSKFGTVIGEVETLAEVDGLIAGHIERVRLNLKQAQDRHTAKLAETIEQDNDVQEWDEYVSELDYAQGDEF